MRWSFYDMIIDHQWPISPFYDVFYHNTIHFDHLFFCSLWSIVFEIDLSAPPLLDQAQDLPTQPSLSTGGLAGESLCWGRAAVWRETGDPIRLRVRLHGPPSPMPPMHTQAQPFLDPPWLGCCPWLLIWPSWSSCPYFREPVIYVLAEFVR